MFRKQKSENFYKNKNNYIKCLYVNAQKKLNKHFNFKKRNNIIAQNKKMVCSCVPVKKKDRNIKIKCVTPNPGSLAAGVRMRSTEAGNAIDRSDKTKTHKNQTGT